MATPAEKIAAIEEAISLLAKTRHRSDPIDSLPVPAGPEWAVTASAEEALADLRRYYERELCAFEAETL